MPPGQSTGRNHVPRKSVAMVVRYEHASVEPYALLPKI